MMKRIIVFICLSAVVLSCLCGCGGTEKEFKEDIKIELKENDGVLIIKEWTFLQGSGAEIYYKHEDGEPVLIGKTSGGDNGFCPFSDGMYEITEEDETVKISWCFKTSDGDRANWRSEYFKLPIK